MSALQSFEVSANDEAVAAICCLNWSELTAEDMVAVAWSYYYFSIQFRENLCLACEAFPTDQALKRLFSEECNTSNLSPYPGIAVEGEAMNHDEFMRRVLETSPILETLADSYQDAGEHYLAQVRAMDDKVRASSMASYEDGGLEAVFKAMLTSPDYDNPLIGGFRFFLAEHIRFDSDPDAGHGSLSRHITSDERVAKLWWLFRDLLLANTPALAGISASQPVPAFGQA